MVTMITTTAIKEHLKTKRLEYVNSVCLRPLDLLTIYQHMKYSSLSQN